MSRRLRTPLLMALGALLLAGCEIGGDDERGAATGTTGTTVTTVTTTTTETTQTETETVGGTGTTAAADLDRGFSSIPDLVDELQPSVVSIALDGGEGSGVIVDSDTVVTNEHVVGGARTVQVVLASGRRVEARVQATDRFTDLAVLELRGESLPPARFAEDLPRVGELAIALGNPLGFEKSVTAGIVSGLHRAIPSAGRTPALIDLIQTDAPISPGNSGGALANIRGEVIGINVAYLPPGGGAVSIGFAIPAATVTSVVEQLRENGRVRHALLGVVPGELTPQLADRFGIDADAGVLVVSVTPDSGAARAGLREGDVVVSVDGKETATVEDLLAQLRQRAPGDDVRLEYVRDGEQREVEARLGERPTEQ